MTRISAYAQRRSYQGKANPYYKSLKQGYDNTTTDLAYIVGVLMGDGHIDVRGITLRANDEDFVREFANALERQFGRSKMGTYPSQGPRQTPYGPTGQTYSAELYSVTARDFLRSIETEEWVRRLSSEHKIAWLRGLWDSEGCVQYLKRPYGTYRSVRFSVYEEWLARLYQDVLRETLGIDAGIGLYGEKAWTVVFSKQDDVDRFYLAIRPTIRRKCAIFEGL